MTAKSDEEKAREHAKTEFFGWMDEWAEKRAAQQNSTRTGVAPDVTPPAAPPATEPPSEEKSITGLPFLDNLFVGWYK